MSRLLNGRRQKYNGEVNVEVENGSVDAVVLTSTIFKTEVGQ